MSGSRGKGQGGYGEEFDDLRPAPGSQSGAPLVDPEVRAIADYIRGLVFFYANMAGIGLHNSKFGGLSRSPNFEKMKISLTELKEAIDTTPKEFAFREFVFGADKKLVSFLNHQIGELPKLIKWTRFLNEACSEAVLDRLPQSQEFRLNKIRLREIIDKVSLGVNPEFSSVEVGEDKESTYPQYRELGDQVSDSNDPQALVGVIKTSALYPKILQNHSYIESLLDQINKIKLPKTETEKLQPFVNVAPGFNNLKEDIILSLSKYILNTKDPRVVNIKQAIRKANTVEEVWPILEFQIALYEEQQQAKKEEHVQQEEPKEEKRDLAASFSEWIKAIDDAYKTKATDSEPAYKLFVSCRSKIEHWITQSALLDAASATPAPSSSRRGLFGAKPAAPKELSFEEIKQLILKQFREPAFNFSPPKAERELRDVIASQIKCFDELKNILELGEWYYEHPDKKPSSKDFPTLGYIQGYDKELPPLEGLPRELYEKLNTCLQMLGKYTSSPSNQNSFRPG